jgi:hypothetical protein
MGKGIREFRASISGKDDDDDDKPEIESGAKDGETVEGEVVTDRRS